MNDSAWLPQIDRLACTGCGDCVAVCQPQAIAVVNEKAVLVRPDACSYCGSCEAVCPVGAISLPYLVMFDEDERAGSADDVGPEYASGAFCERRL